MTPKKLKWDVRVESDDYATMDPTGKWHRDHGMRVRYRRLGSRGRFTSFIVQGKLPKGMSIFDVVNAYEKDRTLVVRATR